MNRIPPKIAVGHLVDTFLEGTRAHYYDCIESLETQNLTRNSVLTYKRINSDLFPFRRVYPYQSISRLRHGYLKLISLFENVDPDVLYWSRYMKSDRINLIHGYFVWTALGAAHLKRRHNAPLCMTVGEDEIQLPRDMLMRGEYAGAINALLDSSDLILATSSYVKKCVERLGAPSSKILVWHPGVDVQKYALRAPGTFFEGGMPRILCVARMVATKGIDVLLQAAAEVLKSAPKVKFILIGDGPERSKLENLCKKLGIRESVEFAGALDHSEVIKKYAKVDLVVLPSLVQPNGLTETFGVVLLEAQLTGTPVIGSRAGGIPETMKEGVTGILVEPGNYEELATAILKIVSNPEAIRMMGVAGRKFVIEAYSLQSKLKVLFEQYEVLLGARSKSANQQAGADESQPDLVERQDNPRFELEN